MKTRFASLLALAAVVAAAPSPAAEDAPRVLAFSTVSWPDEPTPSDATKKAVADILVKRCAHAGFDGVTASVGANGVGVEVRVPATLAASEAAIRRLADRRGRFEFRVRAESGFEQEHRERRSEGAPPPNGHEWADDEHGGLAALVETPAKAAALKVQELVKKGLAPDDAGVVATMSDLAKAQSESEFGNADIATSSVERKISTYGALTRLRVAVRFELKEARKAAFEKFTGDHVGRGLAVVLDGKLHVCPVIKSAIPGEGQWIGPGNGYTDEEAQETSALLACGPLPCRLVAEKGK
jgi:preprotein translocase subunit SecD